MSADLNETLLEMHFHSAIREAFESIYGLKTIRFIKPTPRREGLLAFDQGWVRTRLTTLQYRRQVETALKTGSPVPVHYVAYFLQFKVVHRLTRRSTLAPTGWTAPYYRAELDMKARGKARSQHAQLVELRALTGGDVSYVCPMIFDADDLWMPPDVDLLQVVSVATAPTKWNLMNRHFIAFPAPNGQPSWASEPTPARSTSIREWLRSEMRPRLRTGEDLMRLIESLTTVSGIGGRTIARGRRLPASLHILEMRGNASALSESDDGGGGA